MSHLRKQWVLVVWCALQKRPQLVPPDDEYQSISICLCRSIYLSVYLSIYVSIYIYVYISVYIYMFIYISPGRAVGSSRVNPSGARCRKISVYSEIYIAKCIYRCPPGRAVGSSRLVHAAETSIARPSR